MSLLSRLGPPPNNPHDSSLLSSPQVTGQEEGSEVATLDQDSCLKDPSAGSKAELSRECVQDSVSEDNQSPLTAEQGKRQPRGDDRPKDVQHEEKQAQDSHGGLQEAGASRRPGPTTDQEQPQTQGSSGPLQDKPASDKTRKPRRKKRKPNPESESAELLTPYLDLFKPGEGQRSLHDEILAYERYISSTAAESALRNRVRARIERVVCWCFRDARIHVYGSSATGLCMPNGDIDLVVHTRRASTEGAKKSVLFQLRNALLNDGVAKEAYVVTNARHLVMNVTTSDDTGSYKVDISVNSTEGTSQLDIVREYLNTIPALRPLVLVVKGLLLQHGLGAATSAGLSSYVVMCMAISFLQLNPTRLSEDHIRQPIENRALGELFVRFLKYYADDFPYTTSYISVREKAVLPKVAKGWPPRKQEDALSIECLVDPENDIARAAQRILQARELFRKTHDALRSVGKEGQADSGLPAVLGVSKELVEYRARIEILNRDAEQRATYPSLSGYTSSTSRYDYRNSRGASSSYSRGDSYRPPLGRYETGYTGSSYRDTRGPERNPGRYQPRDEYDIRGYHAMRETRR